MAAGQVARRTKIGTLGPSGGATRLMKNSDEFAAYEMACVRQAAGRPEIAVRPLERPGGLRSRTYLVGGPAGGTFVKCLDAGYHYPAHFFPTLDHEADGYRLFAPLDDGLAAVPQVHFYQSFPGPDGKELQVLGISNLDNTCTPREVYLNPAVPLARKEHVAALCGRHLARLVSPAFQASLDRTAGMAAIRALTDRVLDHPRRDEIVAAPENHEALPWAYQNKVMGEVNVLLPCWLEMAAEHAAPETQARLAQIGRVFADRQVVEALSPGRSSDRIVFSPGDRHDGNTLLVMAGEQVERLYEVDLEFWGLETIGRLVGRYGAIQLAAVREKWPRWEVIDPTAREILQVHYPRVLSTFLYHFVLGDGSDSAEMALRAVSVGLAHFYAAMLWVYVAALFPPGAPAFVDDALHYLRAPGEFLSLAAQYAEARTGREAEMVLESTGGVWAAMQPLVELVQGQLAD